MSKVIACIDGLSNTGCVIEWAAWCALRLDAPLEFLHVLGEAGAAPAPVDFSGAIGLGAQEQLLEELSALDERRSALAAERGRQLLASARARAAAAGLVRHDGHLRHGELVEGVVDFEGEARLFVMGEHRHKHGERPSYLDPRVEAVVRRVKKPVLVVTADLFQPPSRAVIAFDGSSTAIRMVERVATSPLLQGLSILLVRVGADTEQTRQPLLSAAAALADRGFDCEAQVLPGVAEEVLPQLVAGGASSLLVIGAYGHSRIRQFILGSTTTTLLRTSAAPVLVLR